MWPLLLKIKIIVNYLLKQKLSEHINILLAFFPFHLILFLGSPERHKQALSNKSVYIITYLYRNNRNNKMRASAVTKLTLSRPVFWM